MKNLKILGGIVICMLSLKTAAQPKAPLNEFPAEKPLLFADLPSTFNVSQPTIEKIFAGSASGNIKLNIDNSKTIEGVIVERLQRSPAVTTVNIKFPQYQQALFTLSRITSAGNPAVYTGRVVHISYGDALILKQEPDRIYFVKEKQSLLMVE
jgi:hypothetical protein